MKERTGIYLVCFMVIFFSVVTSLAVGELTEERRQQLLYVFAELGNRAATEESMLLTEYVSAEHVDLNERRELLDQFFAENPFTQFHIINLEAHLNYSSTDTLRMARFVGAFAASALKGLWRTPEAIGQSPSLPLFFLESVYNSSSESVRKEVAKGIHDILAVGPLKLSLVSTIENPLPFPLVIESMQACLTLGVYYDGQTINEWIQVPGRYAEFFQRTRVWLFDGTILSPSHVASLESIFSAVPVTLHGIYALHVPEITGMNSLSVALRSPGKAVDIAVLDIDLPRDPAFHYGIPGLVSLPEFTAQVLMQFTTAVLERQFYLRPDLRQRVAFFFSQPEVFMNPAVTTMFPQLMLLQTPEEKMAHLSFLWLINSHAFVNTALNYGEQMNVAPIYAAFLAADLFSEGGDKTRFFRVSPTGILFQSLTAVRRASLTPETHYVNGIAANGRIWHYDLRAFTGAPTLP